MSVGAVLYLVECVFVSALSVDPCEGTAKGCHKTEPHTCDLARALVVVLAMVLDSVSVDFYVRAGRLAKLSTFALQNGLQKLCSCVE